MGVHAGWRQGASRGGSRASNENASSHCRRGRYRRPVLRGRLRAAMHNAPQAARSAPLPSLTMNPAEPTDTPPNCGLLAQLVVKQGVAWVACRAHSWPWRWPSCGLGCPADTHNEAGINQALKAQLAGPAAFWIPTMWNCGAGWSTCRLPAARRLWARLSARAPGRHLPGPPAALARLLQGLDTDAWAQALRAALDFAARVRAVRPGRGGGRERPV
jgi:hypothetical protein